MSRDSAPRTLWRGLRKRALRRSPQLKAFLRSLALNWTARPSRQDRAYGDWAVRELAKLCGHGPAPSLSGRPDVSFIIIAEGPDEAGLAVTLGSLLGQIHSDWEVIVASASPVVTGEDRRMRSLVDPDLSTAQLANAALELVTGALVGSLRRGSWLWPKAVAAAAAITEADADAWLSDDDVRDAKGRHAAPIYKPGWNPELLRSYDYVGPFVVFRTARVRELGGLRDHGQAAAELWDLHLRMARTSARWVHIPRVLCSRPSDLPERSEQADRGIIIDDLAARGYPDAAVTPSPRFPSAWDVHYPLRDKPLVSIVIPSKNQLAVVRRCVDSIYARSTYQRFEVVLVDTGSDDPAVLSWYQDMASSAASFRVVSWPERPFSYSRACNEGARQAEGSLLVMLNNDTEIVTPDWIERLCAAAQRPEIGAVGCLLFFPGGRRVQHAGVGLGIEGIAGNLLSGVYPQFGLTRTQGLMLYTTHQVSAVTAACLAVRRDAFFAVGGFDEQLAVTFNDVDLCLRLQRLGLANVYRPDVRLLHHESISVAAARRTEGTQEIDAARALMLQRWPHEIADDPMLNVNLSRSDPFCRTQ